MKVKAAFMKKLDDIVLRQVDMPDPEPHEVCLKVDACGVCGSDIITAQDGMGDYAPFGHEVAGTLVKVGSAVTDLSPGQKVVLDSASACGLCDNCKNCRQELCTNPTSFMLKPHFGFAAHILTPRVSCVTYNGLAADVASLAEPLGVAIDMHRVADIQVGSHVVVSGLGPIGLMALQLARLSGAEMIYACELSQAKARIELAKKFGADQIIEVDKTPLESVKFKQAPDRFLACSPPQTMPVMFDIAAKGAIISFVGIKYGQGATISFDANEFHFKKLQLRASYASPAMMTPQAVKLLASGHIDGKALISHRFKLDEIADAMRVACADTENVIKVVVVNE